MWDTLRLSAIGKLIGSKVAVLLVAVIMSAFFVAATPVSTTYAADVSWSGNNLSYGGQNYTQKTLVLPGTDSASQIYVSDSDPTKVIIIPGGADLSKEFDNAQARTYTVDQNGVYSNPTGQKTISIDAKADGSTDDKNGTDPKNKTSCAVNGVGWIVCSMSKFLASAMDKAYEWISEFLVIKPLTTDTTSGLFQAWNVARGIANACFIVAFLIIIYSQITSYGISNYEIKKMIPRLIIAAVLVNVSYYICSIAVDVSNILGDSIAKALTEIRNSLPAQNTQITWSSMTTTILSGGTIGAAALGIMASGGVAALVPLLVPILIGGLLSLLVALMVLAARQALVVVLVVIAPIAFVAYLLPNTEKHFERWRGIFMNMLMIFPLFSLLFGGAQLAASIIIQSTDQLPVVILAMFVQVAPLMITPFLMRVSHNLLTQLGGFMDNPRKGIMDRSRNWANEQSQLARERHNAKGANRPWYTSSGLSYRRARGQVHRANAIKMNQERVAAAIANERRAQDILADTKAASLRKSAGEAVGERLFEERKALSASMQRDSGALRLAQANTKALQSADDAMWEEAVTGKAAGVVGHRYESVSHDAHVAHREHHIAESNAAIAQAMQKSDYATELSQDVALQLRAGGIGGEQAAVKVKAQAMADVVKAGIENVNAIKTASDISPGDVASMKAAFEDAVRKSDVASMRAHIDMLVEANNPGFVELDSLIERHEAAIRANPDVIETIRHHINSNAGINAGAEHIAVWSRDNANGNRTIADIRSDAKTWSGMKPAQFAGQKASAQMAAFKAKDASGNWAITPEMAAKIIGNDTLNGQIKENMVQYFEWRASGNLGFRPNGDPYFKP